MMQLRLRFVYRNEQGFSVIVAIAPCEHLSYKHTKRQAEHQRQRQGPIGMHCDAPKSVPDPFKRVMASVKTSKMPLPLGVFIHLSLIHTSIKIDNLKQTQRMDSIPIPCMCVKL